MIEKIFDIASHISTPLGLAGFIAAALFFIIRKIVSLNIFPKLTIILSTDLLKLIIERLYNLSLTAMILGFCGYVIVNALPLFKPPEIPPGPPIQHNIVKKMPHVKEEKNTTVATPTIDPAWDYMATRWNAARNDIKWVFTDTGAKKNYDKFRSQGLSKYAAVVKAQHNGNGHAADTIRSYGEPRTEKYIASMGY